MTGRYPHKFGAPFNLPNTGLGIEEFNRMGIPTGETLIAEVLKGRGLFHRSDRKVAHGRQGRLSPESARLR